ncbi:MAG: sigma-70 family RNA polymerase sigma factor [Oscillospiraceae bacterium]|nr:sigma-70 family RNA polymerase sigma factor [Oscillospiraceae bacterium]
MDKNLYADRVEQLKPQLYRMAFLHLGNEAMALDAVAEAVYRGLISVKKLREPDYFDTWMTRILINECNKIWRRLKREQPLEAVVELGEDEKEFELLPLKEAIRQLPQELKEVVILRYYADFTLAQTAKSLKIPQGTVVTRQRRALKLLRLELLEEDQEHES